MDPQPNLLEQSHSPFVAAMTNAGVTASAWAQPDHPEWYMLRGMVPCAEAESNVSCVKLMKGEFADLLKSSAARPMLESVAQILHSSLAGYTSSEAVRILLPFDKVRAEMTAAPVDVLCVAIAALHAFVQLNWTGPDFNLTPVELLRYHAPHHFSLRSVHENERECDEDMTYARVLHASSLEYLTLHGEPAYHLCQAPFFLVFSLLLFRALGAAENGTLLASLPWWQLRARSVHIRVLDEPVACEEVLLTNAYHMASAFGECSAKASSEADKHAWSHLQARITLECALAHQRAGQDRLASEGLVEAAKMNGLEYELSGALGKRTKWQKEDKTQLVLLAESREAGADCAEEETSTHPTSKNIDSAMPPNQHGWQATVDPSKQVNHQPATYSLNDDTLLEQTQFTKTAPNTEQRLSHLDPGQQPPLAVTDQCILLALCLNIHNTQASHGLTSEQMSAFVERVVSHPQNWSVHTMSLLLRARLESTRTRTVERSTLQLQALIDQMPTNDSSIRERLRFFHALDLPAKWSMQCELADRFVSIGMLRSALETYERIEMWEHVVQCLGLLGQHQEGRDIVRDLLEGRKTEADVQLQTKRIATSTSRIPPARFAKAREAKLWCLLGDLEPEQAESHYLHAWDVSDQTSARAARSLGGYHFALHAHEQAAVWLRRTVRINALNTRAWFMLGCSYMRMERWLEAAAAFRKCTALEEEDGESWNNLASCYMRMHLTQVQRLDTVLTEDDHEHSTGDRGANDGDDDAASTSSESTARDSGVSIMSDTEPETRQEASVNEAPAFELRLLAHKALGISLKFQFDAWRVWSNYMIVSVDVGMLREAARALARIVEIRTRELSGSTASASSMNVQDIVDMAVLNRLVDAVVRPHGVGEDEQQPKDANVGEGLRPAVLRLFDQTLLPRFSSHALIWQSYARLMFASGHYRKTLQARIQSFQCGLGSADALDVVTDKAAWSLAKEELQELCDALANLGPQAAEPGSDDEAMPDWQFRARTLVRSFMSRTRDSFGDEPEWSELADLVDELKRQP